jgi:hypothetical protein
LINRSEEEVANCDYRNAFQVQIDGKTFMHFSDGEPEDANLMRDFADIYSIGKLVQMAYDAGKNGEELEITEEDSEEI